MSFPQVAAVNGGSNTVESLNHTVNLPAGIVAGNLLLVFFVSDQVPTITFPGGWTQLFQVANSTYVKFGAWYRIADGGEGGTITVTTSDAQMTAHTSYRITGYSGLPEVGVSATGASVSPNSPNLAPSWGALDTLWFAIEGNDDGTTLVSGWPAGYGNQRNDKALNSAGAAVGSCRRELNAASQDPGVFTIDASERWIANTVAVKPVVITAPTVTTANASDVEEETATTGGEITATGGANATRRGVKYGLTPGARTWDSGEDGDFGTGTFERDLVGLTEGELYYFEAYATNPIGTSYGAEKTFLTKPDEPTDLNAYPGDEQIQLIWDKGDGAQKTMIRYRTDGVYPTDPADGLQAYFDTSFWVLHTGLTNGHLYKHRAWSYATEGGLTQYSDSYSSVEATPIATPLVPSKYIVEVHETAGDLLAMLQYAFDVSYEQEVNASHVLMFTIMADDPKLAFITKANELWLRDIKNGLVVRKFKLQHEIDARDGEKITVKVTALDYMSLLTDKVLDFQAGTYMDYVSESPPLLSAPITSDDDYLYVADNINWKVKKYLKSDMSYVTQSAANYGGQINAIAVDDTHVYIGGESIQTVWKLLKSDLSYVSQTPDYGGLIQSLAIDDTHIYVGGSVTQTVRKYLKATMAYVSQTIDYGGIIETLAIDDTDIFVGGQTIERIRKYTKATMAYVTQSVTYGGVPYAITLDDDYVYFGGATTNEVWKLNKSDLVKQAGASYGGTVLALAQNDSHVFAGGYVTFTIKRYTKDPLLLHDYSPVYGAIYALTLDDTHIYAVGLGVTVKKYSLFDTVEDIIDELLSYQVNVPAITKGTIAPAYADLIRDIQADGETILQVIMNLRDTLGGYIEVDNDRELNWFEDIGEDKGQQIRYKKNLLGIEREVYWIALTNRVYAYGRSIDGYKVRLSEIQAEDYVEDVPSQLAWDGIFSQVFVAFDITEAETLLAYAEQRLAELKDPPLSYHVDSVDLATQPGFDFDRLRLGSVVRVIDEGLDIDIEAKVVRIVHPDLQNLLKMEVEIATVVRDITKTIGDITRLQNRQGNLLLQ